MGQRPNELGSDNRYYEPSDSSNYSILPADQNTITGSEAEQSPEEIRANIENTRAELSSTISALQEKLNPQEIIEQAKSSAVEAATQVIDHAKSSIAETLDHVKDSAAETLDHVKDSAAETIDHVKDSAKEAAVEVVDHTKQTIHDATIGKVEHMVSNVGETVQETSSGIVDMVKRNPLPATLIGLGLGWFFLRGQNKPANNNNARTYPAGGYGYQNQYPGMQQPRYTPPVSNSGNSEGLAERLMGSIRQNPLPAAVAGISLGYIVTQGQSSSKQTSQPRYETDYDYYNRQQNVGQQNVGQKVGNVVGQVGDKVSDIAGQTGSKVGDIAGGVGQTVSNVAGGVGQTVGNVASGVGQTVSNVAGGVGETVGNVAGGVGETVGNVAGGVGETVGNIAGGVGETVGNIAGGVGHTVTNVAGGVGDAVTGVAGGVGDAVTGVATGVQYQAQRAQSQFEKLLEEKPLAVGVVAMALGVTVGMLLPNTEPENKLLGEARDNLVGKAQEAVQETVGKVSTVAQNVTQEVQETVSREVKTQGLLGDNSGGSAASVKPKSAAGSKMNMPSGASTQRPEIMSSLSSTQLDELERQVRQNDREGFMRLTEPYGWTTQLGEEVWTFMNHRPTEDEVYRAFGIEPNQSGQTPS